MLTQAELKSILHYNPDTGDFTWLVKMASTAMPNTKAGCTDTYGRIVIRIKTKLYYAHRLAYLYMTGEFPEKLIDHIDRNMGNNKWDNLRSANKSENQQNIINPQSNGTSGYRGVSFSKITNKYHAYINVNGVRTYLGLHETAEIAYSVYLKAKKELHPYT